MKSEIEVTMKIDERLEVEKRFNLSM